MHPSARIQSAIEALDQLFTGWQSEQRIAADAHFDRYFRARRYIGSKDRGAVAELCYWVLRHLASLQWHCENAQLAADARGLILAATLLRRDADTNALAALFSGARHAPTPLTPEENRAARALESAPLADPAMPMAARLNIPEWLIPELEASFGANWREEVQAMQGQAPVDLRANTLKTTREALQTAFAQEGIETHPTPHSPWGLRLRERKPVFTSPLFKAGHFEMQDEGSQLIALLGNPKPGQKVIDFCAGAGGKTLALAALMRNKGRILALDTSEKRLGQIRPRLTRAGVDNVVVHPIASESDSFLKRHRDSADLVVVDAPCSGTGTWRRNPDLKWRFTPSDLAEIIAVQQRIIQSAARLVKPGGRILYATCSLLRAENEAQIEVFLNSCNTFGVVSKAEMWDKTSAANKGGINPFLRVTPHQDGVDGFFAALLERSA